MPSFLKKGRRQQRSAPQPELDPRVIAVFQATADGFKGLVARGSSTGIEVVATRVFTGSDDSPGEWSAEHLASRIIMVLPSASVIVRAVQLPRAPEEKLLSALELNATTFVLGRTPDYRVASALLSGERGDDSVRSGVVAEWPSDQPAPALPAGLGEPDRVSFAPEIAALGALAAASEEPLVSVDSHHNAVSVSAPTSKGVMLRIVRAGGENGQVDAQEIGRAIGEACVHAEVPPAEVARVMERTMEAATVCLAGGFGFTPSALARLSEACRLPGAPDEQAWWQENGVLAGVALAAAGGCLPLTQLRATDPGYRASRMGSFLNRMAEPGNAARLIAAALLVIALGPVALQGLRLLVLKWKLPNPTEYVRAESDDNKRLAIYRLLARNAASMTKTLSDIGASAPEGIEFDFINISQSAKGQAVTIRGHAMPIGNRSATEALQDMEQLMGRWSMFSEITRSSDPPHQDRTQDFTLNAVAIHPVELMQYPEEQDFEKLPMRVRKFGAQPEDYDHVADGKEGAAPSSGTATTARSSPSSASSSRSGSRTNGSRASEASSDSTPAPVASAHSSAAPGTASPSAPAPGKSASATPQEGATSESGDGTAAAASPDGEGARDGAKPSRPTKSGGPAKRGELGSQTTDPPPAPLTEAEINAMTKAEAQSMLVNVARARQRADLPEDVLARLKNEFDLLMARCRREN